MRVRVGQNFSKKRVFIAVVVFLVLYFAYLGFSTERPREFKESLPSLFARRPTAPPRTRAPRAPSAHGSLAKEEIEAAPEIELIAEPVSGASHRLATPLRSLQSALDQLTRQQADSAMRCADANAALASATAERLALPFLFYRCAGFCGGLGDRVRGAITTFYLALVNGRCFGMDWSHPVNVANFFHVPLYPNAAQCSARTCSKKELFHIDHWDPLKESIGQFPSFKGGYSSFLWSLTFCFVLHL
jgi:hypothetical protein